jgi:hypothetical protein
MIPMISALPSGLAARATYEIVKAKSGSETKAIIAGGVVGGTVSVFMLDPVGGAGFYAMTHLTTHVTTEAAIQIVTQVTTQDVVVQLAYTAVWATMNPREFVNSMAQEFGN